MALLFADENMPFPTVDRLRQYGHDVLTMLDLDLAGQAVPDNEVLQLATARQCCLLTLNRKDFIDLHNDPVSA